MNFQLSSSRLVEAIRVRLLAAIGVAVFAIGFAGAGAQAQYIRFQAYSDEQGLGNLAVTSIAQDRAGFVLVGTESGLYRYDSVSFTPLDLSFGLPANQRVYSIHVDAEGRTWLALGGSLYLSTGGRFARIASDQQIPLEGSHRLTELGQDIVVSFGRTVSHATIVGNGIGAFTPLFDAAALAATPALAQASFVAADGRALLVGCGSAVCRIEGQRVEVLDQHVGLPADTWQTAIRSRDGTIWVRSLSQLAWRPLGGSTFSVVPVPGGHTHYRTHPDTVELLEDPAGRILTQNDDGLLARVGQEWRPCMPQEDGPPAGSIRTMMFDREGLLWLGTRGGGVFRSLGYGTWEHWNTSDGLSSNQVWGMVRVPGHPLWATTDADAAPVAGHRTSAQSVSGSNFTAVASRRGRMWFAPIDAPLARIDPATGTSIRIGHLSLVRTELVDRSDRLWIGGKDGLYRIDDADAALPVIQPETGLPRQTIFRLLQHPSGDIWALGDRTIYRRHQSGAWEPMASPDILPGQPRSMAFVRPDEIWVGTSSAGVLRFHLGNRLVPLSPVTAPTIGSNTVMFVQPDSRGWVWIGTDHGIDMFDGRSWRRFEKSSGPSSNDLDESAVYEDVDGSMWFGTSHGLSHLIDPAHLPSKPPLHPLVTRIMLGEHELELRPSLHLKSSRVPLIVSFVTLDFEHERSVRFRYRLVGVDAGWNDTSSHEVRYAGLPPGKLIFQVSAFDPVHGNMSAPASFVIKIKAPWWRQWWCYGLECLAGSAVVFAAWQLRIRLLLRGQRLLEQMVQDRTREIEQARRELLLQATSDSLTGLANRRAIMTHLERAMDDARRRGGSLAVLLIDIDHFKKINDTCGHLAGDAVLQQLGRRLQDSLVAEEAVGRYGGEEFLLVMTDWVEQAVVRTGRLRRALTETSFDLGLSTRSVTISGGLAWLRPDDSVLTLLARADAALYDAKRRGRDRIVAAPDADPGPDERDDAATVSARLH